MDSSGWDKRYSGRELIWSAEPNRFLAAEVSGMTPGRALDLACGEGRNAVWLAQRGWAVTGVDFSQVGLDKGAQLAEQRGVSVTWVHADLREYVPPAASFDLVVALYLHVEAPSRREIHRRAAQALAEDGVLLVIGHDASNPENGYGGPQDPAILFSPDDLAADVAQLEIERAKRMPRPVQTPTGEARAIDALLRARRPPHPGAA